MKINIGSGNANIHSMNALIITILGLVSLGCIMFVAAMFIDALQGYENEIDINHLQHSNRQAFRRRNFLTRAFVQTHESTTHAKMEEPLTILKTQGVEYEVAEDEELREAV